MGVDIHAITQIYKDDKWQTIEDLPEAFEYGFRCYEWFQFLRENYECPCPEEAKGEWYEWEDEDGNYHYRAEFPAPKYHYGDGCITQEDICKELRKRKRMMSVPEEWWNIFTYLGGKLPDGLAITYDYDNEDDDRIYFMIEDEEDYTDYWLEKTKSDLSEIMKKYFIRNNEHIRVVFNFDC